jgi:hypothetical protein
MTTATATRLRAVEDPGVVAPQIRVFFETTYFAGLRLAGVPDE